jgi:hypothetical protein
MIELKIKNANDQKNSEQQFIKDLFKNLENSPKVAYKFIISLWGWSTHN